MRTDVAETLNDGGGLVGVDAELGERARGEEGDAVAGRLHAPGGTLQGERLAGDDGWHEVTGVGRVGIGDPCHGLLVGAHVGGHHIDFRADEWDHLHGETSGEAFEFAGGHAAWIATDATFSAAVGEVHERAFPVHPHCERGDFAEIDAGVVSQSALDRPACEVVLHPVAEEDAG